jgi:5,10-methylenetetrahydromethanopterin reductase
MVAAVRQCEASGYHSAWAAEDVYGVDAITPLACYALSTERLILGTCVINPNTRAATLIAMTFATLDQLSGGRMILGIGAGLTWLPMIGKEPHEIKSLSQLRETVLLFRSILRGEEVIVAGRKVIVYDRAVNLRRSFPWPCGQGFAYPRTAIPVYMGARGPKMMQLAADLADGLFCEHSIPLDGVREWTGTFLQLVKAVGRDPLSVQTVGLILCSPSEDGSVSQDIRTFLARKIGILEQEHARRLPFDPSLVERIRKLWLEERAIEAGQLLPLDVMQHFGAIGRPDDCVKKFAAYRAAGLEIPLVFAQGCDLNLAIEVGATYARYAEIVDPAVP